MRIIHTLDELATVSGPVCLAIGVFDGVHRGHQQLIRQVVDDARAVAGQSVVMTFDPHPARVLQPDKAPPLLTSTPHKRQLIEQLGAAVCLLLTFDRAFAQTSPEEFIALVAKHTPRLHEICVGTRFRFGHHRAGDVRLIEKLAGQYGYVAREIAAVTLDHEIISSTAVRQCVQRGDLDRAAAMLGRPFSVLGTVEPGDQRGKGLGYPTANLNPHNEVLPPDGVYAVRTQLGGESLGGVANLGSRPTFAGGQGTRVLEAHLFDFHRDIYGQDLEVTFLKKLRAEMKFPSAAALQEQIAEDVAAARQLIGKK